MSRGRPSLNPPDGAPGLSDEQAAAKTFFDWWTGTDLGAQARVHFGGADAFRQFLWQVWKLGWDAAKEDSALDG